MMKSPLYCLVFGSIVARKKKVNFTFYFIFKKNIVIDKKGEVQFSSLPAVF